MPRFRIEAPAHVYCYCEVEAATAEEAIELSDDVEWLLTDSDSNFEAGDPFQIEDIDTEERFEVMGGRVLRPKEEADAGVPVSSDRDD